MVDIRVLEPDQLGRIGEIDRSEHIDTLFAMERGGLVSRRVAVDVPRWNPMGEGPHSVAGFIEDLRPILGRGAALLGAFDGERMVGVAIVEERFEDDMAWLVFLHVSNEFRRMGIATALWNAAVQRSRDVGARTLYVSATPSGSAVGFYLARGCEVATTPHPELLAEEPEDIHFIAELD